MKMISKISILLLFTIVFYSCGTLKIKYEQYIEPLVNNLVDGANNLAETANKNNYERNKDSDNWEIAGLDTAIEEEYLSYTEKNVILELNKVRINPARYAELYIKPMLNHFNGKEYRVGEIIYLTSEGESAVQECLRVLGKTKSGSILLPNNSLYNLAKDHVDKQGPTGQTGHDGPSGESFSSRIKRLMEQQGYTGENISYGDDNARRIVIQLLVDDGVPSRGHRKNILDLKFDEVGVSIGKHSRYGSMCVIDFGNY